MLFNSLEFFIFLPTIFCLYWFVFQKDLRVQNFLLLISSYFFYGWWDYRFLSLIFLSTVVDYCVGLKIYDSNDNRTKKSYLWVSILFNLGLLGFFKYFNFFIDSWIDLLATFGYEQKSTWTLNVILPIGISFYTFQTMSYSLDIYFRKLKPTKDFISYAAFVSFFPQLVAGPIERASNLLPQFYDKRIFNNNQATDGMRQILWGFFKKVVIADNCAILSNTIFNSISDFSGSTLLIGSFFFAFQIYGDFSGYSDIAIGTSRLFGFELMANFKFPYFSRDIGEFWRRWHISLSTWFRDYLYIPLGGSKGGKWLSIRNIFIIFIISGFWHGANWTFIFWGALNAIYFLPLLLKGINRKNLDIVAKHKSLPTLKEFFLITLTFIQTSMAWIIFRSENLEHAFNIYGKILSTSLFTIPYFPNGTRAIPTLVLVLLFIFIEWLGRHNQYGIGFIGRRWNRALRYMFYYTIIFTIIWFLDNQEQFIYFQF